jgi:hypothetical protein
MCFFFDKAGFSSAEFPYSQSHSTWIRRFIAARRAGEAALYHGYRVTRPEAAPDVGDIIAFAGTSFENGQTYFDRTDRYHSHSDLGSVDIYRVQMMTAASWTMDR